MEPFPYPEIVLTGGPGAGKSTTLDYLAATFRSEGYRVIIVPEAATLHAIGGAIDLARLSGDSERYHNFQRALLRSIHALRLMHRDIALALDEPRTIVLCDRGELDEVPYIGKESFASICADLNLSPNELLNSYDLVLHLHTAAKGAEHAYTLENNAVRHETPTLARELDELTYQAWKDAHNFLAVKSTKDFDEKYQKVEAAIRSILTT